MPAGLAASLIEEHLPAWVAGSFGSAALEEARWQPRGTNG
jgi:hypothetical protein